MKKFFCLIVALMTIFSSVAQVEIDEVTTDKFTGDKYILSTKEVLARKLSFVKASFDITYQIGAKKERQSSNIYYGLLIHFQTNTHFSIDNGAEIWLLLKDGTIIKGVTPTYTMSSSKFKAILQYNFDDFDWVEENNPIQTIRIQTNDGNLDVDMKPHNAQTFYDCFMLVKAKAEKIKF